MKFKIFICSLLAISFLFNLTRTSSYACSCVQPESPQKELNGRDFVFSGKVKSIMDPNEHAIIKSSADLLEIHLKVNETWKGIDETEVIVFTERESASCGFSFTANEDYLVYGDNENGKKKVISCSRTTPLVDASADIHELGEGEKPAKIVNLNENDRDGGITATSIIIGLSLGALMIIFITYFITNKRKNSK
ncbi:hypothetical protein ACH0B5_01975 [Ureibacillus sp. 179-F W5.1 NHS]|uniref:Tissue inhibitor of metalloproteinase n=1 Tax=Lysinibacillus halotolerans TaxID=1368476 RepID=A0A3M8HEL3_9BACI|nr:hypothetical protein [Lysinibacillus halotolerans]RND00817.1 hypothetical protein EC501_03850 [Lysinibacillus halotolerans]